MKEGWVECKLGDILELVRNGLNCKQNKDCVGVPISRIETIATGEVNLEKVGYSDVPEPNRSKFSLQRGDILFSHINSPPHIGKCALVRDTVELVHGVNLLLFRPSREVTSPFLQHFLSSLFLSGYWRGMCKQSVNQASVNQKDIKKVPFAYPPVEEQRRIVAVLDEAFEGLARARAHAEANLQNAQELFESLRFTMFSEQTEGWENHRLADCFRLKSGDNLTSKKMIPGPYPVYGGNGIAGTHCECNLSGNNVIVGRVGALCGNARFISEDIWLTDNAFKVVNYRFVFDHRFLAYLLNFKDLRSLARQAAQPVISNSSLADLQLSFPKSVETQKTLASRLSKAETDLARVRAKYESKLKDIDDLRQSLLQKAFEGELT